MMFVVIVESRVMFCFAMDARLVITWNVRILKPFPKVSGSVKSVNCILHATLLILRVCPRQWQNMSIELLH